MRVQGGAEATNVFFAYIDAVSTHEWDEMWDLPGEMRLDRLVGDDDCAEQLRIISDYEQRPELADFTLTFVYFREPVCGAERAAQ